MVKDFRISSVDFRDIFGHFRSLIFNFWAHRVKIWTNQVLWRVSRPCTILIVLKFENETSKNIVILYHHPGQKVLVLKSLFWDDILGWYVLIIQIHNTRTLEVKHGLGTFQRSWFTQILTPWASQEPKNLKWKIDYLFSSQTIAPSSQNNVQVRTWTKTWAEDMKRTNIDESRRTRWERRHLAFKKIQFKLFLRRGIVI